MKRVILLVEDERPIRRLVHGILARSGAYRVLVAKTGEEGIQIGLEFPSTIHLLLANAILPGMLGTDVAVKLKAVRPAMRVILLTGKAHKDLAVLNGGFQRLEKARGGEDLLDRVRAELGGAVRAAGGG